MYLQPFLEKGMLPIRSWLNPPASLCTTSPISNPSAAAAAEPVPAPEFTFHLFPKLPPELRSKIWNAALPGPRTLELEQRVLLPRQPTTTDSNEEARLSSPTPMGLVLGLSSDPRTITYRFKCKAAHPTILSVCRESRYETLRLYTIFYVPKGASCLTSSRGLCVAFNSVSDTVVASTPCACLYRQDITLAPDMFARLAISDAAVVYGSTDLVRKQGLEAAGLRVRRVALREREMQLCVNKHGRGVVATAQSLFAMEEITILVGKLPDWYWTTMVPRVGEIERHSSSSSSSSSSSADDSGEADNYYYSSTIKEKVLQPGVTVLPAVGWGNAALHNEFMRTLEGVRDAEMAREKANRARDERDEEEEEEEEKRGGRDARHESNVRMPTVKLVPRSLYQNSLRSQDANPFCVRVDKKTLEGKSSAQETVVVVAVDIHDGREETRLEDALLLGPVVPPMWNMIYWCHSSARNILDNWLCCLPHQNASSSSTRSDQDGSHVF